MNEWKEKQTDKKTDRRSSRHRHDARRAVNVNLARNAVHPAGVLVPEQANELWAFATAPVPPVAKRSVCPDDGLAFGYR